MNSQRPTSYLDWCKLILVGLFFAIEIYTGSYTFLSMQKKLMK